MFSGGSYDDVSRWLRNFLTVHAKRDDPRDGDRHGRRAAISRGRAYGARVRLGDRLSEPMTFDYREVARQPRHAGVVRRARRTGPRAGALAPDRRECPRRPRPIARALPAGSRRATVNGFLGLALDNITNLVILSGLLIGVFGFPADLVLGRMLPGTALGVLVGDLAYTCMAVRLMRRTGRTDVTAMPFGIDTPDALRHGLRRARPREAGHRRPGAGLEGRHGA